MSLLFIILITIAAATLLFVLSFAMLRFCRRSVGYQSNGKDGELPNEAFLAGLEKQKEETKNKHRKGPEKRTNSEEKTEATKLADETKSPSPFGDGRDLDAQMNTTQLLAAQMNMPQLEQLQERNWLDDKRIIKKLLVAPVQGSYQYWQPFFQALRTEIFSLTNQTVQPETAKAIVGQWSTEIKAQYNDIDADTLSGAMTACEALLKCDLIKESGHWQDLEHLTSAIHRLQEKQLRGDLSSDSKDTPSERDAKGTPISKMKTARQQPQKISAIETFFQEIYAKVHDVSGQAKKAWADMWQLLRDNCKLDDIKVPTVANLQNRKSKCLLDTFYNHYFLSYEDCPETVGFQNFGDYRVRKIINGEDPTEACKAFYKELSAACSKKTRPQYHNEGWVSECTLGDKSAN